MKALVHNFLTVIKCQIANALTFLNLAFGCISLIYTLQEEYFIATNLIIISAILDRFDGKIARKLDTTSEFGKELDSLADLVSFGVAPALLIWSLGLNEFMNFGLFICLLYILSGAFRLARFNSTENHGIYIGVPITIAGGFMSIIALMIINFNLNQYIVAGLTLLLSYLMVTTKIKIVKR